MTYAAAKGFVHGAVHFKPFFVVNAGCTVYLTPVTL